MVHLQKSSHSVWARARLIKQVPWVFRLGRKHILTLVRYMESYEAARGQTILWEGRTDAHLLLIVSGHVRIAKSSGRTMKTLTTIGPGEIFGEMSLIDGKPRSASAIAATDVRLMELSQENFTRLQLEEPTLGAVLLFKLADFVSQHLRQTTEALVDHTMTDENSE